MVRSSIAGLQKTFQLSSSQNHSREIVAACPKVTMLKKDAGARTILRFVSHRFWLRSISMGRSMLVAGGTSEPATLWDGDRDLCGCGSKILQFGAIWCNARGPKAEKF